VWRKNKMRKPVLGEKLFLVEHPHYASEETGTYVFTVTKVGRKYFEIQREGWSRSIKFRIEDWTEKTDYSSHFSLYENEQAYLDDKKKKKYIGMIKDAAYYSSKFDKLSVETLEKIIELAGFQIEKENE
jgi:hypothetical protein